MSQGTYEESLPTGGKLSVTRNSWNIDYYFPGPDLRFNGTFMSISGSDIDRYIKAFQSNWEQYEQLVSLVPDSGELTKEGRMGMPIRVGGALNGVYLKSYHMRFRTKQEIDRIITTYQNAKARAAQIQQFLRTI